MPGCWAFNISKATTRAALDLLNALAILSNTTVSWSRRPATILEIKKRPYFSNGSTIIIYIFFKPLIKILRHRDHRCGIPTIDNLRFFQTHKGGSGSHFSEQPVECNQDLWGIKVGYDLLRMHWRLNFDKVIRCSTLRLWVGYFIHF